MSSSFSLWQMLPSQFLKIGYRGWCRRLDPAAQRLVVELAQNQKFKCFFCIEESNLVIDHDHDPYEGDGDRPTIHNIRGLVCHRCNTHLSFHERNEAGEYTGWEHVDCFINSRDYEEYDYAYECRRLRQYEDRLERTVPNYWSRRLLVDKFYYWTDGRGDYPWKWYFEEIKEKRYGEIRTPRQAINTLHACLKFIAEQREKDPNFRLSDEALDNLFRINSFMDSIRPFVQARLEALGYNLDELALAGRQTN